MQYAVLRNHNRHIVLVIKQTPKVTQYLEAQATGIVQSKMPTAAFVKEYDKDVPITVAKAAESFLQLARRAYVHNLPVIQTIKEIIMATAPAEEAIAVANAVDAPTEAQQAVIEKKAEKAAKVKAARPPAESKPRGLGIGAFCKEQIQAGVANAEILVQVKAQWPEANTTIASLNWYRNDLKKGSK